MEKLFSCEQFFVVFALICIRLTPLLLIKRKQLIIKYLITQKNFLFAASFPFLDSLTLSFCFFIYNLSTKTPQFLTLFEKSTIKNSIQKALIYIFSLCCTEKSLAFILTRQDAGKGKEGSARTNYGKLLRYKSLRFSFA
jgi:hypothetical protein